MIRRKFSVRSKPLLAAAFGLLLSGLSTGTPAIAQTLTVLHTFLGKADGAYSFGGVVLDSAGNLYGTTYGNGHYDQGTLFKIDPSGTVTILHAFQLHEGCLSFAPPTVDSFGNIYGTTSRCGSGKNGTVFEMRPSGKFFVLHTFGNKVPHDPGMPYAGLTLDSAGDVYGTGTSGGNCCFGAVFKLDHRTGAETVVYAFGEPPDGASPEGAPVKDAEGNLYGTTSSGGPVGEYGYGIVYKIDPAGAETILWTFTNGADGANPGGTLVRDRQGNLYGTTYKGGIGEGVVFKLDPNGEETILHNFGSSSPDGSVAVSGLTADADGNLYGTTMFGGAWGWGCVYKVNRNGEFKVIYSFTDGNDGGFPFASPVMDSAGNLYGTTTIGGDPNCYCGTVYKLSLQ